MEAVISPEFKTIMARKMKLSSCNIRIYSKLFPPEFSIFGFTCFVLNRLLILSSIIILLDQFFFINPYILYSCSCWIYIGIGVLLSSIVIDRLLRHRFVVHRARVEDKSEVDALIIEAENIEPRNNEGDKNLDNYSKKEEFIKKEVKRLKEEIGAEDWTEYQVLSLSQMLVNFLKVDDLISRSQSSLADLDEWSQYSGYSYDKKYYDQWMERIKRATKLIETKEPPEKRDDASEPLRAELRMLLEHIADYKSFWAKGSAVVRSLMLFCWVAIPFLIIAGLTPTLYHQGNKILMVINWGLLGAGGALTSVILYLYKTNRVEVGNTEGKNELWRAVIGTTLGFVAGILAFSIIKGKLISGTAIPNLDYKDIKDIYISVIWAFGTGFSFEKTFDKVKGTIEQSE